MTPEQQAAMRQALELLDKQWQCSVPWSLEESQDIADTLRQALEQQPADEPVVYIKRVVEALYENSDPVSVEAAEFLEKLYTRPQPAAWVGLTDDEVDGCHFWKNRTWSTSELVRHVEAKLREKNHAG